VDDFVPVADLVLECAGGCTHGLPTVHEEAASGRPPAVTGGVAMPREGCRAPVCARSAPGSRSGGLAPLGSGRGPAAGVSGFRLHQPFDISS